MPIFHTKNKKKKCILLISGYRDIPFLWNEIIKHFIENNIDYYGPRTFGNGRSFFQYSEPNDWIISYLESIYILQELYEEIDIIAFSTGCIIALYLSQFKYKCKINNLILCAPFLLKNYNLLHYIVFDSFISWFINPIINWFLPLRYKALDYYPYPRDINYIKSAENDFYELVGHFEIETKLMKFKNFRPKKIYVNNIIILNANDDQVIGDIYQQRFIINNIFLSNIPIITIPTYKDKTLPQKCAHVMFKEDPIIIKNIFDNLIKHIS